MLETNTLNRLVRHNSSASEFAGILEALKSRKTRGTLASPYAYAQDGSILFRGGFNGNAEVWALSPSAPTITNAHANLADLLLTNGDVRRFKRLSPNDLSVALMVKAGSESLLLGADLENTASQDFGWKAVLQSTVRPREQSRAFKISHHGSLNGHHADVWTSMLLPQPIALVTPFVSLRNPLPTTSDVARIKAQTTQTYCTTWPASQKPPRRQGIDGIVNAATKSRRALATSGGHIRLRLRLDDPAAVPTIELFGRAKQL